MRAYKFLSRKYGLESLCEKRLKISRISKLNDPFELAPYVLTNSGIRNTFFLTRDDLDKHTGLVCFSDDWRNPLTWAHYSDGQEGMCLGFEIPDIDPSDLENEVMRVAYKRDLLQFPADFDKLPEKGRFKIIRTILSTKFKDWQYEREIRWWVQLQNKESGLQFLDFSEKLRLVEAIVGARCKLDKNSILKALGPLANQVKVAKACASFSSFQMAQDEEFN
jgi:hypothetical protein